MTYLTLKVPPAAVFLATFGLIVGCSQWLNWANIGLPVRLYVVLLCLVFAGYLGLSAIFEFYRVNTTVHPVHPERARVFVNRGVYKISRNPMYLGLLIILVGCGYWFGNLISFVFVWGFIWYMNQFQIIPEERALRERFGEPYEAYKATVRRWI